MLLYLRQICELVVRPRSRLNWDLCGKCDCGAQLGKLDAQNGARVGQRVGAGVGSGADLLLNLGGPKAQ